MPETSYAIALGSNRAHSRYGDPRRVIMAAVESIVGADIRRERLSRVICTPALGPAGRSFANAVLIVSTNLAPPDLLKRLKDTERSFGRRRGRRWGPRVLDLDVILWTGGCWEQSGLVIPHSGFRDRDFVLRPLAEVSPEWRDPITGRTVRQLLSLHRKARPTGRADGYRLS